VQGITHVVEKRISSAYRFIISIIHPMAQEEGWLPIYEQGK
jgi:hypothetical protein